jgi:hypothetical protein
VSPLETAVVMPLLVLATFPRPLIRHPSKALSSGLRLSSDLNLIFYLALDRETAAGVKFTGCYWRRQILSSGRWAATASL